MSNQLPSKNVISASVSAPIITAAGPDGLVIATTIRANTVVVSNSFSSVNLVATSNVTANNVTASSNVSSVNLVATSNVTANNVTASSNVRAVNLVASGDVFATNIHTTGTLSIANFSANGISSNTLNLSGQQILSATAEGLVTTEAPFLPITMSGIKSINVVDSNVAFQGNVFSNATTALTSTYTYLWANVCAYVNRDDPQASRIPDLNYAKYDQASGNVEYCFDMVILYPTSNAFFSNVVVYEAPNRGIPIISSLFDVNPTPLLGQTLYGNTYPSLNTSTGVGTDGQGPGNRFLFEQGDMIVWTGWEGLRPQSLSDNITQLPGVGPVFSSVSAGNPWPGQFFNLPASLGGPFAIQNAGIGLGMTLPACYYGNDVANNNFVTGECTDFGYFPTSNVSTVFAYESTSDSNVKQYNSFGMYYPFVEDYQINLTIPPSRDGTQIPVDNSLFYTTNGEGNFHYGGNLLNNPFDFTEGFGGLIGPVINNTAYCTVDRRRIMLGTDGLPMHRDKPQFFNKYADALEVNADGFLIDSGSQYNVTYTGFQTKPLALGALGVRDIISALRYSDVPGFGSIGVPKGGMISNVVFFGESSSGLFGRGFLYNGFNVSNSLAGGQNKPVFDGFLFTQCSIRREEFKRFGKQNETALEHFAFYGNNTNGFPFLYQTTTDAYTGRTDGVLKKYETHPLCAEPKIYQLLGDNEILGGGSLLVTNSLGKYIAEPDYVKTFYMTGSGHIALPITSNSLIGEAFGPLDYSRVLLPFLWQDKYFGTGNGTGLSQALSPVASTYIRRSCYWNMKKWLRAGGSSPIASKFPNVGQLRSTPGTYGGIKWNSDGTSNLQSIKATSNAMGYSNLQNITTSLSVPGLGDVPNTNGFEYLLPDVIGTIGNRSTIKGTNIDYFINGSSTFYPVLLPYQDSAGVGVYQGGIPTPESAAPLMSLLPYNPYIDGFGKNDMAAIATSAISLASNAATLFINDPRPTVNALYSNATTWGAVWGGAVATNIANGWMLGNEFPYEQATYTARATVQAALLVALHGLPPS